MNKSLRVIINRIYSKVSTRIRRLPKYAQYFASGVILLFAISGVKINGSSLGQYSAQVLNMSRSSASYPQGTPVTVQATKLVGKSTPTVTQPSATTSAKQNMNGTQCNFIEIPFGTSEQPRAEMNIGQTVIKQGYNGREQVCTDTQGSQTVTVNYMPVDEVKYVGTREPIPTQNPTPQYTYGLALSLATQTCTAKGYSPDSTDMTYCKNTEMHKYGY